jgi:hypothetical protein
MIYFTIKKNYNVNFYEQLEGAMDVLRDLNNRKCKPGTMSMYWKYWKSNLWVIEFGNWDGFSI